MTNQQLYDYIDQRIDELTIEEKEWRNSYDFLQAGVCVSRKLELLDLKIFIQEETK